MEGESACTIGGKLVEVNFAREFKDAIVRSSLLKFSNDGLSQKILEARDDQLLVLTSTINSPKLVERVDYYNAEFIEKSL